MLAALLPDRAEDRFQVGCLVLEPDDDIKPGHWRSMVAIAWGEPANDLAGTIGVVAAHGMNEIGIAGLARSQDARRSVIRPVPVDRRELRGVARGSKPEHISGCGQ